MANVPRIFVSHSHADNGWCVQLVEALTGTGFDAWFDKQGLYVGDQLVSKLEAEIENRDVFLIVLTPDSWSSRWVRREYELALHRNKRILGVKHKPVELTSFITTLQILDAVGLDAATAAEHVTNQMTVRSVSAGLPSTSRPGSANSALPRTDGVYMARVVWLEDRVLRFFADGRVVARTFSNLSPEDPPPPPSSAAPTDICAGS